MTLLQKQKQKENSKLSYLVRSKEHLTPGSAGMNRLEKEIAETIINIASYIDVDDIEIKENK